MPYLCLPRQGDVREQVLELLCLADFGLKEICQTPEHCLGTWTPRVEEENTHVVQFGSS